MPKADNPEPIKPTAAAPAKRPRLGETIKVRGVPERSVLNNELGQPFGKEVVPVTVTSRILRLLDDGDIVAV